jgi:hypothetical protein
MTEAERAARPAGPGQDLVSRAGPAAPQADRRPTMSGRDAVHLAALLLIVADLVWKAELLRGQYFVRDDFHDLDLAIEHPLSWSYLTYIWDGHLIIGLRLVAWFMVRTSLYNWGLAVAITLILTAAACLACYRALRALFGDGPRILLPLLFYLLTPLTIPTFSWWSSAMESVPLQLAIFMALTSHVRYVNTGRTRHLIAAGAWVAFGLIFFEKALVVPLLLFAITAGYLVERRGLIDGARVALRRCWPAWAVYLALMVCYLAVLLAALRTSVAQPQFPASLGTVGTLVGDLLKDSFFPGVFGGPWQWFPDNGAVLGGPPPLLAWLCVIAGIAIVIVSVVVRRRAWLAWAIMAGWVLAADVAPLVIGRTSSIVPGLLGLDIRYVADAAPVVAICLGLVFWPPIGSPARGQARPRRALMAGGAQPLRMAVAGALGIFVLGSIWSVQQLEKTISGAAAKSYIANATEAVRLAPRGTAVYDWPVPSTIVPAIFGRYAQASAVIGDIDIGKLHWITKPDGTIDNLTWFGADGKLHPVWVGPTSSIQRSGRSACWPERHGQIVIKFVGPTSVYTWILRMAYLLGPGQPSVVTVSYGNSVKYLTVQPGLHAAYLPESGGGVTSITIGGLGSTPMCVGDAEAGNIISSPFVKPIP